MEKGVTDRKNTGSVNPARVIVEMALVTRPAESEFPFFSVTGSLFLNIIPSGKTGINLFLSLNRKLFIRFSHK